jgi:hypothetical protein
MIVASYDSSQYPYFLGIALSVFLFIEARWNMEERNWPGPVLAVVSLIILIVVIATVSFERRWVGLVLSSGVFLIEIGFLVHWRKADLRQ